MIRARGWRPDDAAVVAREETEKHVSNLIGALSPVAAGAEIDYAALLDKIPDQGPTSSCVGQALATALFLTAAVSGAPIPRPSAKLFYDFARAEDQPYVRLVDDGSRPLAAMRCGVDKGMVAEADWAIDFYPSGSSNINTRPPLDVFESALGYRIGDYYRIAAGAGASELVDHALARGFCPIFAMPVDEAYERLHDDSIYEGRKGSSLGGHMQAIAGKGDGFKRVVGSWGTSFGARGLVRIANDYFDSGECTDILVATVVPALVASS